MANPIRYRGYHYHSPNYVSAKYSPTRRRSHPRSPKESPKDAEISTVSVDAAANQPEEANDIPVTQLEIRVVTGDVMGAGTDANVYIHLYGTEGDTGRQQLTKKYTNLFERGRTDCFQMDLCTDIGDLTKLRIEHDDTGFGAAWLLDRVEIVNMETRVTTVFLCGEWLDSSHGTVRDLMPQPPEIDM